MYNYYRLVARLNVGSPGCSVKLEDRGKIDVRATNGTGKDLRTTLHNMPYVPGSDRHLLWLNAMADRRLCYYVRSQGISVHETGINFTGTGKQRLCIIINLLISPCQ